MPLKPDGVTKLSPGVGSASGTSRLVWLAMIVGIILRLRQYAFNRSLWLDESLLALNLLHRCYGQLFKPLDYNQGSPLGFLLVQKWVVNLLGPREYALRLFPLVCGIVSVLLFYAVARRFLSSHAVPIAVALFALTGPLVRYSSEVKQYSTDVAVALALLWMAVWVNSARLSGWRLVAFAATGAIALWFSHPALFVLAGVSLVLTWTRLRCKRMGDVARLVIVNSFWVLNLTILYFVSLRSLSHNHVLLDYWKGGFMPLAPHSLSDVNWFIKTFITTFSDPGGIGGGISILAFLLGIISLSAKSFERLFMLVVPCGLTLLASGIHKYPFRGRLLLFLVPVLVLLVAEGAANIQERTADWKVLGILFLALLFFRPALSAGYDLIKPPAFDNIRPVLSYVQQQYKKGDIIYFYWASKPQAKYYADTYGLLRNTYNLTGVMVMNPASVRELSKYEADMQKLYGRSRVWIVFSHVGKNFGIDDEKFYLYHLERTGSVLDTFEQKQAAAYLFDLTGLQKENNPGEAVGLQNSGVKCWGL